MSEIGTHKKLGGNVDMNNTKEQTLPGKSFFFIAALPPFSMRIFNYWHTNLIVFTRKRKTSKKMNLSFSFHVAYFIDMVIVVSYLFKLNFYICLICIWPTIYLPIYLLIWFIFVYIFHHSFSLTIILYFYSFSSVFSPVLSRCTNVLPT